MYHAKAIEAQTGMLKNILNDNFFTILDDDDPKYITLFMKQCEKQRLVRNIWQKCMKTVLQSLPYTKEGTNPLITSTLTSSTSPTAILSTTYTITTT